MDRHRGALQLTQECVTGRGTQCTWYRDRALLCHRSESPSDTDRYFFDAKLSQRSQKCEAMFHCKTCSAVTGHQPY